MKSLILFCITLFSCVCLHGQGVDSLDFETRPTSIYQVVKHKNADTAIFYYNDRWQLVKPVCATIIRISRIDTVRATFTGKFIDYYQDSTIAVEGAYDVGKKEGIFKIYFPDGQLEQTGNYEQDKKKGIWEYYYETGHKRQLLDFQVNEIRILEFWDENGNKLVDQGNGEWYVYETAEKFVKISGQVMNGKKHGTWKKSIPSKHFHMNIEKYNEGKLVSGKSISMFNGTQSYKDTSYCFIERVPTFITAELFEINRCYYPSTEKNNREYARYPGGIDRFYSEICSRYIMSRDNDAFVKGVIRIQMTIDVNGKMTNFKPVSNLGVEYDIIRILQTMGSWFPSKINGKPTIQPKIISFQIR